MAPQVKNKLIAIVTLLTCRQFFFSLRWPWGELSRNGTNSYMAKCQLHMVWVVIYVTTGTITAAGNRTALHRL